MKYFFILFISLFLLTSCWEEEKKPDNNQSREQKVRSWSWAKVWSWSKDRTDISQSNWEEFFIETKTPVDFNTISTMEKIGKVVANQNIELKSQASGKITKIFVKQWETVKKWTKLAQISDSYSKYYLDLDKAQIDLDKQYINKDSQLLSLNQRITDSKITLDDALKSFNNAKITFDTEKQKALIDLDNSKITAKAEKDKAIINYDKTQLEWWSTQAKLEYEKAEIDYNNTLNSNKQQLQTHIENIKKEYNNLYLSLGDITRFWDEIMWISSNYKNDAKKIDKYLGVKDSNIKNETIVKLKTIIAYKSELALYDIWTITEDNMLESMQWFSDWYFKINDFLDYMEKTLENSIASIWTLSQNDIDWYISKVNSFQNSNNGNNSSFTNTQNSVKTFLNTYKESELSALKNVELQKIKLETSAQTWEVDYNKSLSSLDNQIKTSSITYTKAIVNIENAYNSSKTKLDQAQQSYNNAIKNRDVNVRSLNNSIASALNSKKKAQAEYSKLSIISPIDWIIGTINVDLNAEVTNNTSIVTIASNSNTQVEVTLNANEITQVTIWDKVKVQYGNKTYDSEVYSKSSIADDNLGYTVWIVMNEKVDLLGWSTVVRFLWTAPWLSIPLQVVEIEEDNVWFINTLVDWKSQKVEVQLWKIDGNNVEILSTISDDIEIITTEIKNYNDKIQKLVKIEK